MNTEIRIYATFDGTKDLEPDKHENITGNLQMTWVNVRNDAGQSLDGLYHCNVNNIFNNFKLKRGNRYVIGCKEIKGTKILYPTSIKNTYKNVKCDLIRCVSGDYTFIKGKFQGKWLSKLNELEKSELHRYLLWLAKNTDNEGTVINAIKILGVLNT